MKHEAQAASTTRPYTRAKSAFVAFAIGDALAQPATDATDKHPIIHSATTTWLLAVLETMVNRSKLIALDSALAIRLGALSQSFQGAALRGPPMGFRQTLLHVGKTLDLDGDLKLSGVVAPRAESLISACALGLAVNDTDEEVAEAVVRVVSCTHRHPESIIAAGAIVGAARKILRQKSPVHHDMALGAARKMADLVSAEAGRRRRGVLPAPLSAGEGAIALALAASSSVGDARDMLGDDGIDHRDAPARIAAFVIRAACAPSAFSLVDDEFLRRPDREILLPLLMFLHVCAFGDGEMPMGFIARLATKSLIERRLSAALLGTVVQNQLDEELVLTARGRSAIGEPRSPPLHDGNTEQLTLL